MDAYIVWKLYLVNTVFFPLGRECEESGHFLELDSGKGPRRLEYFVFVGHKGSCLEEKLMTERRRRSLHLPTESSGEQ